MVGANVKHVGTSFGIEVYRWRQKVAASRDDVPLCSREGGRNDERRAVKFASLCRISEAGKRQPAVFFRLNRGVKSGLNFTNVIGPKRGPEKSEDTQRLLTTRQHIIVCEET
jgi:hypothetical protein